MPRDSGADRHHHAGPGGGTHDKANGTTYKATSTPSGFCWFHDPEREQERAEARRKGGKQRSQQCSQQPTVLPLSDAEDVSLATVADVVKALATTFNKVQKGELDPKTGNCLALISGQLLKAMQGGDLATE